MILGVCYVFLTFLSAVLYWGGQDSKDPHVERLLLMGLPLAGWLIVIDADISWYVFDGAMLALVVLGHALYWRIENIPAIASAVAFVVGTFALVSFILQDWNHIAALVFTLIGLFLTYTSLGEKVRASYVLRVQ